MSEDDCGNPATCRGATLDELEAWARAAPLGAETVLDVMLEEGIITPCALHPDHYIWDPTNGPEFLRQVTGG